jgi:hypothetical protein
MDAAFLRDGRVRLSPAVVLSGGNALGTVDYFYPKGTGEKSRRIGVADAFCLAAISREPAALLLNLGPGSPELAGQEVERLCLFGESVGMVQKSGIHAAVLTHGKEDARPLLDEKGWADPEKVPPLSRAFTRIVFGNPMFTPFPKPLQPPQFSIKVASKETGVHITYTAKRPGIYATNSDPFAVKRTEDRLFFTVSIPDMEGERPSKIELMELKAGKRFPKISKVAAGWEWWKGSVSLHVLVLLDRMGGERVFRKCDSVRATFRLFK